MGKSPIISDRTFEIVRFAVLIAAIHVGLTSHISSSAPLVAASTKPLQSFDEFYPFYISQHADETCRRLHFVGTSIIILMSLFQPFILTGLALSAILGVTVFKATIDVEHGLIEGGVMLGTFIMFLTICSGSLKKAISIPLIAYTFAWVGHFMFEHNRPATFIYPTYSLVSDFKLWLEIATFSRKF